MSYRIVLSSDATKSLKEQINWYESRQNGLWQRLFNGVSSLFELLTHYPFQFELRREPYRIAKVKKFPILIIYELEEQTVYVYKIFNTHQNTDKIS